MQPSKALAVRLIPFIVIASCAAADVASAQGDPFTGTWKLNAAKSTSGTTRPTFSQVLTFTVTGDLEDYRSEVINAQGTKQITVYQARYDGQVYPSRVSTSERAGESAGDEVVLRKIDARTRERIVKREGRVVRVMHRTLSSDGRTLTSVLTDIDSAGRKVVASTLVYEKQ
jgi:hypothetical protein